MNLVQVLSRFATAFQPSNAQIKEEFHFFVRVDQAGMITKRHSATSLQFARFGGACPLWNVHRTFEKPSRFLRQLAETPDGKRFSASHATLLNQEMRGELQCAGMRLV